MYVFARRKLFNYALTFSSVMNNKFIEVIFIQIVPHVKIPRDISCVRGILFEDFFVQKKTENLTNKTKD